MVKRFDFNVDVPVYIHVSTFTVKPWKSIQKFKACLCIFFAKKSCVEFDKKKIIFMSQ